MLDVSAGGYIVVVIWPLGPRCSGMRRRGRMGEALPRLLAVLAFSIGISGLVVEYIVAIDVTRVRFPADAALIQIGVVRRCLDNSSGSGRESSGK